MESHDSFPNDHKISSVCWTNPAPRRIEMTGWKFIAEILRLIIELSQQRSLHIIMNADLQIHGRRDTLAECLPDAALPRAEHRLKTNPARPRQQVVR